MSHLRESWRTLDIGRDFFLLHFGFGKIVEGVLSGENPQELFGFSRRFEEFLAVENDMVSERTGFFDEVEVVSALALGHMTAGFSLRKKPLLASAEDHIHAGLDELLHDLGGVLAFLDTGHETRRAGLDQTARVHQARANSRLDGFVHDAGSLARCSHGATGFFTIRAKCIGVDFHTIGMGGAAAVGGRRERIGHVAAIDGDIRNAVPVQIRIRPGPKKPRGLPVGNPRAIGVDKNHTPCVSVCDQGEKYGTEHATHHSKMSSAKRRRNS